MSFLPSLTNHMPRITWGDAGTVTVPPAKVKPVDLKKVRAYEQMFGAGYRHTKDWAFLEDTDYRVVFLYCDLMRGGKHHNLIEPIIRTKNDQGLSINPYAFSKERYEVFQTKDGHNSYPVALPSKAPIISAVSGQRNARGKVKGWLYFVRSESMYVLDNHKQNSVKFRRKLVDIQIPYRIFWPNVLGCNPTDEDAHTIQAWMYVGVPEFWGEVPVRDLDKCRLIDPTERKRGNRTYHSHTRKRWHDENEPYYLFDAWGVKNNK